MASLRSMDAKTTPVPNGRTPQDAARKFDKLHPACDFELEIDTALPKLLEPASIAVYRVVQEALSNVVKHSGATHCVVRVGRVDQAGDILLTVDDDGRGFDLGVTSDGIGLIGMRERMTAVGGSIDVSSPAETSTTVRIRLPLHNA